MGSTNELTILEVLLFAMLGMFLMAIAIVLFFVIYQKRILKEQVHTQKLSADHQASLLSASIAGQEKERNRLSKDLHDDIGGLLTTIRLYADQIDVMDSESELKALKEKTTTLVDTTIQSVRQIAYDLHPVILENLGLMEGLQNMVDDINQTKVIHLHFNQGKIPDLTYDQELALFRIIQELVNNTLKHAQATQITLNLEFIENEVELFYTDNGVGYNPDQLTDSGSLGLKNIESRAKLLEGNISYLIAPGSTTVKLNFSV